MASPLHSRPASRSGSGPGDGTTPGGAARAPVQLASAVAAGFIPGPPMADGR